MAMIRGTAVTARRADLAREVLAEGGEFPDGGSLCKQEPALTFWEL